MSNQLKNRLFRRDIFLPALLALPSAAALWLHLGMGVQDILCLVLYGGLWALFAKALRVSDRRCTVCAFLVGGLFALFTALSRLDWLLDRGGLAAFALSLFGFWLFWGALLCCIYAALSSFSVCDETERPHKRGVFFASWGALFLCFLFWFLYRYPGGVTIDSNLQLLQAMGRQPLSNHHPIIHTFIIKLFFSLGLALSGGDQNTGVAVYSAFQALMLSGVFAFLIETLYESGVKKWVLWAVLASFILLPYHGSYSVTMWKDVWFGAMVLILSICLWRLILSLDAGRKPSGGLLCTYFVSSVLMCLFRSNGFYAFIALTPFIILLFFRKHKAAAFIPLAALAAVLLVKGPLYSSMGVVPPDTIESLSIPAQHIAKALCDGAELDDSQLELLSQAVDPQALAAAYTPTCSDSVKELVRHRGDQQFIAGHKGEFLRLWLELGLKYPGSYLRAQLAQTQGYWDPSVQYWLMAPDFVVSYDMDIEAKCLLPDFVKAGMDRLLALIPALPGVSLIFSIGFGVWVFLALMGLCLARREYARLVLFIPVLAVWGTLLIATPVYAEFRYIYSLFTTLPLLGLLPFYPSTKQ